MNRAMSKKIGHGIKINGFMILLMLLLIGALTLLVMPGSVSAYYGRLVLGLPDLTITDISCRNCFPTWWPWYNWYCDVEITVKNIGWGVAPESYTRLKYLDYGDPNVPIGSWRTPSLDISESYTHVRQRVAMHSMSAFADHYYAVRESNEWNNWLYYY